MLRLPDPGKARMNEKSVRNGKLGISKQHSSEYPPKSVSPGLMIVPYGAVCPDGKNVGCLAVHAK
ncbi:hypothetical protein GCM10009077_22610 [Roseibium denhamense]